MKLKLAICIIIIESFTLSQISFGQALSSTPEYPVVDDKVVLTININNCENKSLIDYTGDVYVHTGVYMKGESEWKYVISEWSENTTKAKCSRIDANLYQFTITPDIKSFYGINNTDTILTLNFVVRSSDGSKQSEDLFLAIYNPGLTIEITNPAENLFITEDEAIEIQAKSINIGTDAPNELKLYVDDTLIYTSSSDTLKHSIKAKPEGQHWIKVSGSNASFSASDSIFYFVKSEVVTQELPDNAKDGINYLSDTSVALVLFAPQKENVFVIGDFNNWELDNNYQMKRTPDNQRWWVTINGLTPKTEYAYQYFVNGKIKIADPFSERILDPWNDKYIPEEVYPNLKAYPYGKTSEIVGVLETGQEAYPWKEFYLKTPKPTNLVIYEVHIQNFTDAGTIKMLKDTLNYLKTLGINAIELMPVNEFEGNLSWGYNPSFYFAPDKIYGTEYDLKDFIEQCHINGIVVILDMVLNHSFGQSPLVRLYWDDDNNQPASNNPWFNTTEKHNFNVGYDMNHESNATKAFCSRVMKFWLQEYNIDGFRFDLSKGFTQKNTLGNTEAWAQYDESRIAIWKQYSDTIRNVKSDAIIILEHFAVNSEEKELADYGFLLWSNMNYEYNEATMGYSSNFSHAFYTEREWTIPGNVVYMESHDEERLMYKNTFFGNVNGYYSIKDLETGLQRMEAAAALFFTIPGPKMIWEWQELGYDYSINTCLDGSVNDCRLDLKPIKWDYYSESARYRLNKVYEALIDFKNLSVCRTEDFSFNVNSSLKSIHLNGADTNATIVGNFGMFNRPVDPAFQHTGTWFDYLSGETLVVENVNDSLVLKPGEYHIYTDIAFEVIKLPKAPVIPDISTIWDKKQSDGILIYPNPVTKGTFTIQNNTHLKVKDLLLEIKNLNGQVLCSQSISILKENTFLINISDFPPQILLYNLTGNDFTTAGIIVVQ